MEGTRVRFERDASGKIIPIPDEKGLFTLVNDLPKLDTSKYRTAGIDPIDPTCNDNP